MPTITCTKCGAKVSRKEPISPKDDMTLFVCEKCQEKINLTAYQSELKILAGFKNPTESEKIRMNFLKTRIAAITKK